LSFPHFTAYFTCIVKVMYNLLYYQIVLQFCTRLTDEECEEVITKFSETRKIPENGVLGLGPAMALVLNNLDRCKNFRQDPLENEFNQQFDDDDDVEMSEEFEAAGASSTAPTPAAKMIDLDAKLADFELELQSLCLPYLRNAALLRHHIYHQELPEVKGPELEFARLVYFLELVTKSMDWKKFNAAKALCFAKDTEISLPIHWCEVLKESRPPHDTTRELITSQHMAWHQPQLLALPREYERLFTVSFKMKTKKRFRRTQNFHKKDLKNNYLVKKFINLMFFVSFAVLLRAGLPQVFIRAQGKLNLFDLRQNCMSQANVLQRARLL
jgi:E3 ubiquitin-protein ligase UBR3